MFRWLEPLWRDVRYGARGLSRDRTFAITVTGTLTLGIGLMVAWFAVFEAVFLRPWPVPHPETLVMGSRGVSASEYRHLREHASSIQLVAMAQACPIVVIADESRSSACEVVSGNYFDVLGVPLARGRSFRRDEDVAGAPIPVAVISYELWRERFALSADAVGSSLNLNGLPFTVIGIAAQGSRDRGQPIVPRLWLPLASYTLLTRHSRDQRDFVLDPSACCVDLAGRVVASPAAVSSELTRLHRQFEGKADSKADGVADELTVTDTREINRQWTSSGPAVGGFSVIAVFMVLAAACANAANLQLARGRRRRNEFLIRFSLGASRWQVVRQLLMENVVLIATLSALVIGAVAALAGILTRWLPGGSAEAGLSLSPDWIVIVFAVCVCALAVFVTGIAPVLRGSGQLSQRVSSGKARSWFLSVQVGMSVALIICASLLARGLHRAVTDDPGFDAEHVARVFVTTPAPGPLAQQRLEQITSQLKHVADERGQPVVAQASLARIVTTGATGNAGNPGSAGWVSVSSNYFELLKVPLREGRVLRDDDPPEAVVVNESFATRAWPAGNAIGATFAADQPRVVVGVVGDMRPTARPATPTFYSRGDDGFLYVAREPAAEARAKAAVHAIAPDASVIFDPLSAARTRALAPARVAVGFSWAIALVALTMACAGVFAVVSLVMDERRQEIGIRMALGAGSRAIVQSTLRGTGLPLAGGAAGGVLLALGAGPLLRALLVGVAPVDPIAFGLAAVILVATAVAATIVPLRRALRVDPSVTLRAATLVLAATSAVAAIACGASVPEKTEAAAALSRAIASTVTRTLPSSTYCMTANPDFSFRTMSQNDLVATFQNLKDKDPLYNAAAAGIVSIELREFRFDPAGRSPDPSCDAMHAQSKKNGYTGAQIRLAVVRTTLTPKATSAGVQLDTPIEVATRELVDVTEVLRERGGGASVKYTWQWKPTKLAGLIGYTPAKPQEATARLRLSDAGWVVEESGVR